MATETTQAPNTSSVTIDPYNSSTGAGTLSYYAQKYNTTPEKLFALNQGNPDVKDINTISAGGKLYIPSPLYQSTTGVDNDITNAANKVSGYLQSKTAGGTGQGSAS